MILVLIGYMGSGKSSVGKQLAEVLDYQFIDLDAYIADAENTSIPEIFAKKGEIYFRKVEAKALNDVLNAQENCVLALGGGTPCYGNNMNLILNSPNIQSVYLKTGVMALTERLLKEKDNRPLISHIQTKEDMQEYVGKHMFERSVFYNQSHLAVTTDGKTVKDIVESILLQLI